MHTLAAFGLFFLFSISTLAQGRFLSGLDYSVVQYRGYLSLTCKNTKTGQTVVTSTYCRTEKLKPVDTDFFIAPKGVLGDRVYMSVLHSSGVDRSRVEAYDSNLSRTVNRVNLWNPNLFLKPILERGQTKIDFTIFNKNKETHKGTFIVTVSEGEIIKCSDGMYSEMTEAGCSPASVYCDRYYSDIRYCK